MGKMHIGRTALTLAAVCAVTTASMDSARAQDEADETKETAKSDSGFKPLALTLNPLTLILGRIGLNIEYLPAPHHGIMLNPYFSSMTAESDSLKTSYSSFGGELGYHFYSGERGANGFFIGPQAVFISSTAKDECKTSGCVIVGDPEATFTAYGVALDLGWQHVGESGFTIGVGGGFMYLKSSSETSTSSTTVKFEGSIPRLLFTIGYSL